MAWSPIDHCPFTNPTMLQIARNHNVTVAQVCLRWILDRGCSLAVGTGHDPKTIKTYTEENLDLFNFALSPSEMARVNAIAPHA